MKHIIAKALSVLMAAAMLAGTGIAAFAEDGSSQYAHQNSGAIHYPNGSKLEAGTTNKTDLEPLRPYYNQLLENGINIDNLPCKGVIKMEVGKSVLFHTYAPIGESSQILNGYVPAAFKTLYFYDENDKPGTVLGEGQTGLGNGDYRCDINKFTATANGTAIVIYRATPYAYGYYKIIAGNGVNPVIKKFTPSANYNDFLTSQALPLGQASVAGKKVKAFYDVFAPSSKYPPAYIGSYDYPMGTWYGQPEPDVDKLPVKELCDTMDTVGISRFEDNYVWEPLLGAWVTTASLDSTLGADLLYPWMQGGSFGIGATYYDFKADPTILRYQWRSEPTNTPGAALAKEHDAKWMRHLGAWMYPASFENIYGEMADGWSMLIYPNGTSARGGFYDNTLEREKEGPGPYEFVPPDVKSTNFANTLLYIEYTDGSWGYIPLSN